MKYSEIMANSKESINIENFDNLWQKIQTECSDILESYNDTHKLLYRGVDSTKRAILVTSPTNRAPRDSEKVLSKIFDEKLKELGIVAIRSNSIFTTSDKTQTYEFGEPYVVFPLNGFKFSYTNEKDLTLGYWQNIINKKTFDLLAMKYHQNKRQLLSFNDALLKANLNSVEDLLDFVNKLFPNDVYVKNLTSNDIVSAKELDQKYQISQTDIEYAIRNDFEVLIHGKAYLISDVYEQIILERIKP